MLKFTFIIILFIQIINSKNILWTGNNDIYWDNPLNWDPCQIPAYNDNVLIPINSTIPPYSDKPIHVNNLDIHLMLDLYETTACIQNLTNSGFLNLYHSNITIMNPSNLIGQIKLTESIISVPLLTLSNKYSAISGAGIFNGSVYNEKGTIRIESEHILTFLQYEQNIDGSLLYYIGNSSIITNYAKLEGNIYVYFYNLYEDNQIIFKSQHLTLQDIKLSVLNSLDSLNLGNLTVEYTDNSTLLIVHLYNS